MRTGFALSIQPLLLGILLTLPWVMPVEAAFGFAWQEPQTGTALDLKTLTELLADRQNFSIDAILQIVKNRGVNFELTGSAKEQLAAAGAKGRRDESLMAPMFRSIAENCKQCAPRSADCDVAGMIRDGMRPDALYQALSEKEYKFSGGARLPEFLLGTVPPGAPLSGAMLAVLCRLGATEKRLTDAIGEAGIRTPSANEQSWVRAACPKAVVNEMEATLAPPCPAGQYRAEVTGINARRLPSYGQFDLRLLVDDYVGVHMAGDTVCAEALRGNPPRPSKLGRTEYQNGPLPRRPLSTWEIAYAVVEGPESNVKLSVVPASASPNDMPSLRVLIEDQKKGPRDYQVRLYWALKPFASAAEIDRFLRDVWSQEFDKLLRDAQRRGIGFPWNEPVAARLKRRPAPPETIAALAEIPRLECDANPYSADELLAAAGKSMEQVTNRVMGEIIIRGILPDVEARSLSSQESPLWNPSITAAIQANTRPHNRPKDWRKK